MKRITMAASIAVLTLGGVLLVIVWGLIIANEWGLEQVPSILLGSVTAIAMIALAFLTHRYVVATQEMARAMKEQTDAIFTPRLVPRLRYSVYEDPKTITVVPIVIRHERGEVALNVRAALVGAERVLVSEASDYPMVEEDEWIAFMKTTRPVSQLAAGDELSAIVEYEDMRGIPLHSKISLLYDPASNQINTVPSSYGIAKAGHPVSRLVGATNRCPEAARRTTPMEGR